MSLVNRIQSKSLELSRRKAKLAEMLRVEYGDVDRRSLFWGAVGGAVVAGFLAERLAPNKNLPRTLLRYSGLSLSPWHWFG